MAAQSSEQTRKLVAFVAMIFGGLAGIYLLNRNLAPEGTVSTNDNDAAIRQALERLVAHPDTLSMTMQPGPKIERGFRRVEAPLLPPLDILVLGQSDADHLSGTFFRDGAHFHNGFLSNSIFAYQFEVFEEVVAAHGVPKLVLMDVRSGYLLSPGKEPAYDSAAAVFELWDGALFSQGALTSHWYTGLDSLLSLQQTEQSVRFLAAKLRARRAKDAGDTDDGAPFHVVPQDATSTVHRWLADGTRVYPNEVGGVVVPRGQARTEEATGDRHVNHERVEMLGKYLDRLRAAGATVIVYSPPVSPQVFTDEPRQRGILQRLDAALRPVVESRGFDYCDLSAEASALGCTQADYYDEMHLSRGCNRKVVEKLASGCAKTMGPALRARLAPELAVGRR